MKKGIRQIPFAPALIQRPVGLTYNSSSGSVKLGFKFDKKTTNKIEFFGDKSNSPDPGKHSKLGELKIKNRKKSPMVVNMNMSITNFFHPYVQGSKKNIHDSKLEKLPLHM